MRCLSQRLPAPVPTPVPNGAGRGGRQRPVRGPRRPRTGPRPPHGPAFAPAGREAARRPLAAAGGDVRLRVRQPGKRVRRFPARVGCGRGRPGAGCPARPDEQRTAWPDAHQKPNGTPQGKAQPTNSQLPKSKGKKGLSEFPVRSAHGLTCGDSAPSRIVMCSQDTSQDVWKDAPEDVPEDTSQDAVRKGRLDLAAAALPDAAVVSAGRPGPRPRAEAVLAGRGRPPGPGAEPAAGAVTDPPPHHQQQQERGQGRDVRIAGRPDKPSDLRGCRTLPRAGVVGVRSCVRSQVRGHVGSCVRSHVRSGRAGRRDQCRPGPGGVAVAPWSWRWWLRREPATSGTRVPRRCRFVRQRSRCG